MLVGVISDSHGNRKRILEALHYLDGVDHILHAGDFYEDAKLVDSAVECKVTAVAGNCDYMVRGPFEEPVCTERLQDISDPRASL